MSALVGLAATISLGQIGFYLTAAALPLYLRNVGAAQSHIGSEVGTGSVAALAATLVLGPLLNRRGPRIFLTLGPALYVVAATMMLAAPTEVFVTLGRTIQGLGSAFIIPSALTAVPLLVRRQTGAVLGSVTSLNTAALAVGPPIGLLLYAHDNRFALLLPAIAFGVIGVLLAWSLRLPQPVVTNAASSRGYQFDRRWTGPLIANCLNAVYFGGIVAYLPLVLQRTHGPNAGLFFTADAVGVMVFRIPSGMLADRTKPAIPMIAGLILTLVGLLSLVPPASVLTLIAAGAGTGIGAGLFLSGVLTELVALSNDRNRGSAMSLSAASFNLGIFAGSAISGFLIGPTGFDGILVFGALCCVLAFPPSFLRPRVEVVVERA